MFMIFKFMIYIFILLCSNLAFADQKLLDAAQSGNLAEVKRLLGLPGQDVSFVDEYGNTALHFAALTGHLDVVRALVDAKSNVNAVNVHGNTPLHNAAAGLSPLEVYSEIVWCLLASGADVLAANKFGKTPLDVALMWKNKYTEGRLGEATGKELLKRLTAIPPGETETKVTASTPISSDLTAQDEMIDLVQHAMHARLASDPNLILGSDRSPKALPFLPRLGSEANLVDLYNRLGLELQSLPSAQTHSDFFVDYAEQLLNGVIVFSADKVWEQVPIWWHCNGKIGELGNSAATEFRGGLYDDVAKALNLAGDDEFKRNVVLPRATHFKLFREELGRVNFEKRATYEWFTLFTARLSFATVGDWPASWSFGYWWINTGFSSYAALIAHWELWKSERVFKRFFEIAGDDVTLKMRSPLALIQSFPRLIMIPCPFQLTEHDLIQLSPIFPSKETNIVPIGFPFVSEKGDDDKVYLPHTFFFHDVHHLAITELGQAAFATGAPLSLGDVKKMYLYMQKLRALYAQAVQRLNGAIADKSISEEIAPSLLRFFHHLLFEFLHEGTYGVKARLRALADPDFLVFNMLNKGKYSSHGHFFPESKELDLEKNFIDAEHAFKRFIEKMLGTEFHSNIRAILKVDPVQNLTFTGFGSYTIDVKTPRAISLAALESPELIPTAKLDADVLDMYSGVRDAPFYYYFFTGFGHAEFDARNAWVIRFVKKE
jgi:hypothetical protein